MKKIKNAAFLIWVLFFATAIPVSAMVALSSSGCTREKDSEKSAEEPASASVENITASYRHKGVYSYLPDHFYVVWDKVPGAESYEVRVIKKDGTEKIYTTENNSLTIFQDDFITGCIAGGTVEIKAIGEGLSETWSEKEKISHNQIHIGYKSN